MVTCSLYDANAIQGVGATGEVINYVTVAQPKDGDWLHRVTAEATTDDFDENGFHYRASAVSGKRFGAVDFVAGAAFDKHDLFYDGHDRAVGIDTTQGELMDSTSWSPFGKVGVEPASGQRLEATANYLKVEGDGDYRTVLGNIALGVPATSEKRTPAGDPTFNEAINLALAYTHDMLLGGKLTVQGFYYDSYALYGGDCFSTVYI